MSSLFPRQLVLILTVRNVIGATAFGGAVFTAIDEGGHLIRVVADHKALPRMPMRGESWEVAGLFSIHPRYGQQFIARQCSLRLPRGRLIIHYLAHSPEFVGIGESRARHLYEVFGQELVSVLNRGDTAAICSVLERSLAENLVEVWSEKYSEIEIVAFLDEHGFNIRFANKLRRIWGGRTSEMLKLNPYYLLAFASWKQVDSVALKIGVEPDGNFRLVGAVEGILYERLQEGHTLTSHNTLVKALIKRIQSTDALRAIELALSEGAIVGAEFYGYQPVGVAALEAAIIERINRMLANQSHFQNSLFGADASAVELNKRVARVEMQQGFSLNSEQRSAVIMAITRSISVMTGGAGSGKTTVLRVVMDLAKTLQISLFQMAVTGKAAKRMADMTGYGAMTVAKFLINAKSGKQIIPERSLFVVDEASMLDLPAMYRILKHLPGGARMVLVGDPAQLPPIGFGLVFHRLAESILIPRTHLLQVHRQAETSGIPAVASSVRQHNIPKLSIFNQLEGGVSFVDCVSTEITPMLFKITSYWKGEDWQILSPVNDGPGGINEINESFHLRNLKEGGLGGFKYGVGDPVIYLVNDYDRELMNGTLGCIVSVSSEWKSGLTIDFEGVQHFLASNELPGRIALAYAISVHKSQGSQFNRVIVVVKKSRTLDNSLIYTALTRGVEQVVFVGNREAFENAVQRPSIAARRDVKFFLG